MPESTRPLDKLVPYARNARKHSTAQVSQLEASMQLFGWTIPVLLDEKGVIIAGHGRVMAAERIYARGGTINGLDGKPLKAGHAPVLVAKGWGDDKKRAYIIADNKLAENADWDKALLKDELLDLRETMDLDVIGFDEDELDKLLASKGDASAPGSFPSFGEDIETEHSCPKCGYVWSGKADAA